MTDIIAPNPFPIVPVIAADREALYGGLISAAHPVAYARRMADTLPDSDGGLQMLARYRLTGPSAELERLAGRIAEIVEDDGGCWHPCSGCQESNEGYVSERDYPYSPIFKCQPGGGCHECGGIGVLWSDGAFLASYGEALELGISASSCASGEVERLMHVIDRNRYTAAACVSAVEFVLHTRRWLREAGRGSYAYDDERYQQEFGLAFDEIREALRPMRAVAQDKTDCTTDPEKVQAARAAGADRFAALSPQGGTITRAAVDAALDAEWFTDAGGDVPAVGQSYSIREVMEEFGANLSTREIENAMQTALAAALNPPGGNEWAITYDREGPR